MHMHPGVSRPQPQSARSLSRKVEQVLTILLLLPALPVMAVAWVLVKLTSPGPGVYRQRRAGLNGREFFILKLRTMTHGCERNTGAVWAQPHDPRITPVGRVLRKTHLDELPQLFNVLRGEMALVGPRPERPEIVQRLVPQIPNYLERLRIRPGVTGLAQIQADSDLTIADVKRKLTFDLQYARSMSLWLDLRIILCTAFKMVGLNRPWLRAILFPGLQAPTIHRKERRQRLRTERSDVSLVGSARGYTDRRERRATPVSSGQD